VPFSWHSGPASVIRNGQGRGCRLAAPCLVGTRVLPDRGEIRLDAPAAKHYVGGKPP